MGARAELDRYLMFDLADVSDCFLDHGDKAYAVVQTLACGGDVIPESFIALYLGGLEIDTEIMSNVLAWFMGLGYLDIECDCGNDKVLCAIPFIRSNSYFSAGEMEKRIESAHYKFVGHGIASLTNKIYT